MSRRDTIIVAVLVNAALLMVLFATALRSGDAEDRSSSATPQLAQGASSETPPREDLLNQYITAVPTPKEPTRVPIAPEEVPIAFTPVDVPVVEQTPLAAAEKFASVTVKQGDFLEKIAKANNTTVSKIMQLNQLSSTQLKIGQVLKVPLTGKPMPTPTRPAAKPSDTDYYIVQDGDSPWLIASRNNIKLADLLRLNDLDEQKARRIRPGDKLRIR